MTIRTLLATATICSFVSLAGCATREAAKIDPAEPSPAMTTTAPTGGVKTDGGSTADASGARADTTAGRDTGSAADAGTEIRLETVYFGFDSHLLGADARKILSSNASRLNENRHSRVIIEGHTDEIGSDAYNLALGEKRALAVRRYIETLGVSHERLETISYGEEKPAVSGHDEEARAKNRRVEFVIVK